MLHNKEPKFVSFAERVRISISHLRPIYLDSSDLNKNFIGHMRDPSDANAKILMEVLAAISFRNDI